MWRGDLSPTERLVVHLASQGLPNAEIARARRTSVFTVTNQLGAAYRKLGVSGRRELVALLRGSWWRQRLQTLNASLSGRELEVWSRAHRGEANKVIACDLGVSLSSVANYLSRARRKLGLNAAG